MDLNFEKTDKALVLNIVGRLDTGNYEQASEAINQKIDEGAKSIIADLSLMDYISSSGLRVFLMALKRLKALGGQIILCSIQPKIQEVFEISGFNTLFIITKNLEAASNKIIK
ncbi:MAG: hypothetical protein AUJ98_06840 [Bacteroidetes bacterium CG2_30_33_31]|nr:MAG: hypothetical protein AUJ98_06840 [Bacteroidetes bacterium CG2_30_33_31]